MAALAPQPGDRRVLRERPIYFAASSGTQRLSSEAISVDNVGQKTFGLAGLPEAWTLPFLAVSAELAESFVRAPKRRKKLLSDWTERITATAKEAGIMLDDQILVRSSGCSEGISRRGKFYSAAGEMRTIGVALRDCLEKLAADEDLAAERVPLLIQKRSAPVRAKGHLSNERRCYEENRDWIGEFESAEGAASVHFQINLRHWRRKTPQNLARPLLCAISPHISEALKMPADWAYRKGARVHFEWVWDGSCVYVVQADEEAEWTGHDPVREHRDRADPRRHFHPPLLADCRCRRRRSLWQNRQCLHLPATRIANGPALPLGRSESDPNLGGR